MSKLHKIMQLHDSLFYFEHLKIHKDKTKESHIWLEVTTDDDSSEFN